MPGSPASHPVAPLPAAPPSAGGSGALRSRRVLRRWGIVAQLALLATMFVAIPAILYKEFEGADRAKAGLLLQTVQDQGSTIAAALEPLLTLKPSPEVALDEVLTQLAGARTSVKLLFRPAGRSGANAFYYIAASRRTDVARLGGERDQLARYGVLQRLTEACAFDQPEVLRYSASDGSQEAITAVVPVLNAAGCWAVIVSYSDEAMLQSSLGQDYWQTTEVRVAAAIYLVSAVLVLLLFLRLWRNLRRFSAVAAEIRRGEAGGSFAARNRVPELADVAREFDGMVESLRKLSSAAEGSPSPIMIMDADGRIEYANSTFYALTGYAPDEVIGQDARFMRSDQTPAGTYEALWETISRGEIWRGELCSRKRNDEVYWAQVSISCLQDRDGRIVSYILVQEDITERKRSERHKALLMAELNHRVKNSLATVKSIASQMLRQTGSLETFRQNFEGRLQALSQAHDLLTSSNWEGADLRSVVQRALRPFERTSAAALAIDGPPVMLVPRAALVLSMTFHELATNAAKYGALSVPGGRVAISWRIEPGRPEPGRPEMGERERLVLEWRERGGPPVLPPVKHGFGRTLIERGMSYEIDAEVSLRYLPEGVECEIRIPWPIGADEMAEGDLAAAA